MCTTYVEGVDHLKPQVTKKKPVAFLDILLQEVFLKSHRRVLSLWCCLGSLNQGDLNLVSKQLPLEWLGFKQNGAGKICIFVIIKAFIQALIRLVHDWCKRVLWRILADGIFNQTTSLSQLSRLDHRYSVTMSQLLEFIVFLSLCHVVYVSCILVHAYQTSRRILYCLYSFWVV